MKNKYYLILLLIIFPVTAYPKQLEMITIEQAKNPKHFALRQTAQKISFPLSDTNKQLIQSMKETLEKLEGVGLAAPQVDAAKNIIAVYIPENAALLRDTAKPYPMHILINASYKPTKNAKQLEDFEACYSVKSKAGKIPRYDEIQVTYQDETGKTHKKLESGFYARVLQHEIDHVNGVLIIDRLTPKSVQGTLSEILQLRRDELPLEKQKLLDNLLAKKGIKLNSSKNK